MRTSIEIADQFAIPMSVNIGLRVQAKRRQLPAVVGCSLRSRDGTVVDLPARDLSRPGFAYWGKIEAPEECWLDQSHCGGHVIFALYSDSTLSERLADTGWQAWEAARDSFVGWENPQWIGESQAAAKMVEGQLLDRYGELTWPN